MWYRSSKQIEGEARRAKAPRNAFTRLAGAGLARLREHMLGGQYAMLSAHRGLGATDAERAENNRRQRELKRYLMDQGYGWVDTRGAWSEPLPEGGKQWVFDPEKAWSDQPREAAAGGTSWVAYACAAPLPMTPLAGVLPLEKARSLPVGAFAACVRVAWGGAPARTLTVSSPTPPK